MLENSQREATRARETRAVHQADLMLGRRGKIYSANFSQPNAFDNTARYPAISSYRPRGSRAICPLRRRAPRGGPDAELYHWAAQGLRPPRASTLGPRDQYPARQANVNIRGGVRLRYREARWGRVLLSLGWVVLLERLGRRDWWVVG